MQLGAKWRRSEEEAAKDTVDSKSQGYSNTQDICGSSQTNRAANDRRHSANDRCRNDRSRINNNRGDNSSSDDSIAHYTAYHSCELDTSCHNPVFRSIDHDYPCSNNH